MLTRSSWAGAAMLSVAALAVLGYVLADMPEKLAD